MATELHDQVTELINPVDNNTAKSYLTPALRAHLDHYSKWHQTTANRWLHFLGIPLFLIASLGLLGKLTAFDSFTPPWQPTAAWGVILVGGLWYIWTDWLVGLLTVAFMIASAGLGLIIPYTVLASFLVAGVVAHWVGHFVFERKPPAIFSSLTAIIEAPPWLVAIALGLYR